MNLERASGGYTAHATRRKVMNIFCFPPIRLRRHVILYLCSVLKPRNDSTIASRRSPSWMLAHGNGRLLVGSRSGPSGGGDSRKVLSSSHCCTTSPSSHTQDPASFQPGETVTRILSRPMVPLSSPSIRVSVGRNQKNQILVATNNSTAAKAVPVIIVHLQCAKAY